MTVLKHYISTSCISFTFSCLFYLLFSSLTIFPAMNEALIVHMLFITMSINCLIFLTHRLPIQNSLLLRFIELLDVIIILLVAGALFNIFPFTWQVTTPVVATGVLTYIIVIIVVFMGNQKSATEINAVIARKKGGASIG